MARFGGGAVAGRGVNGGTCLAVGNRGEYAMRETPQNKAARVKIPRANLVRSQTALTTYLLLQGSYIRSYTRILLRERDSWPKSQIETGFT